jgi:hypothetical protein
MLREASPIAAADRAATVHTMEAVVRTWGNLHLAWEVEKHPVAAGTYLHTLVITHLPFDRGLQYRLPMDERSARALHDQWKEAMVGARGNGGVDDGE